MARADAEALKPLAAAAAPAARDQGREGEEPGIFYGRNDAFIHFHDEDGALFADLKKPGGSGLRPLPAGDAGRAAQAGRRREAARARFDDD